jgi:mono/diheme cytochrome c family protein
VRRATLLLACLLAASAAVVSGCGEGRQFEVSETDARMQNGAELFHERCGGCHTLTAADSRGSKPSDEVAAGERTNGPNFNVRKENREDVLFAIRNGGFSGGIMPANIVVGQDAEDVALFLERYAGSESSDQPENEATTQGGQ